MTPRVQVTALDVAGHGRGRRQRDPRDRPVPLPRLPRQPRHRRRHRAHQGRPRRARRASGAAHRVTELLREPLLVPETLTVDRLLDRLAGKSHDGRRHRRVRRHGRCRRRWRTSSRRSSARCATSTTRTRRPTWPRPGRTPTAARSGRRTARPAPTSWNAIGLRVPEGPYETLAGLVATELGRIPAEGDSIDLDGWRLDVVDAAGRRAARVLLHAPLRLGRRRPRRPDDDRDPAAHRSADPGGQRLLRRRRVRADLRAPQSDRAAGRGRQPAGPQRHVGPGARVGAAGGGPARHHPVHPGARHRRRARDRASAGAGVRRGGRAARRGAPDLVRDRADRGDVSAHAARRDGAEEHRAGGARHAAPCCSDRRWWPSPVRCGR